jgi:chromosome condensin MukBEF MukE localization factor
MGGAIYVRNEDGKYVIVLDINQYGGRITVRANDETPVAQMRSGRDGGVIVLGDKNGRGIWGAPSPW